MRFLLLTTFLFSFLSYAQEATTVIVDKTTNSPIPFMVITTENDVLTTNENGEIEKSKLENSPFKIVSDTYKTQIFDVGFSEDTIFMEQEAKLLEETKIVENKSSGESYQLGYFDEKLNIFPVRGFGGNGYPANVVSYIPYDGKKAIIENLLIRLKKYEKDSLYTCVLMSVDEDLTYLYPKEVLFSYTLTGASLKNNDPIDISNLEIEIPKKGIFVGVKSASLKVRMTKKTFDQKVSFSKHYVEFKKKYLWLEQINTKNKKFIAAPFGVQMKLK